MPTKSSLTLSLRPTEISSQHPGSNKSCLDSLLFWTWQHVYLHRLGIKGKDCFWCRSYCCMPLLWPLSKPGLDQPFEGLWTHTCHVSMCAGRQCRQPWKWAGQAGWGKGVCEARVLLRSSSSGPVFVSRWWAHITWSKASLPTPGRCQVQYLTSSGDHLEPYHCWHFLDVPDQPARATWIHFMYDFLDYFQFDKLHLYMAKGTQHRLVICRSQWHI